MLHKYKWFIIVSIFVFLIFILKTFFFDYYKVSTGSMIPIIIPGHYILISKFLDNDLRKTQKNDMWVFKKPNWNYKPSSILVQDAYVKRCIGLPGDIVYINRPDLEKYSDKKENSFDLNIFPHDSTSTWFYNKFGPFWVPKSGSVISLNKQNIKIYSNLIQYEAGNLTITDKNCFINNKVVFKYKFKKNYYFMLGDNFYDSNDSRIWGPVPQDSLIGKVVLVL